MKRAKRAEPVKGQPRYQPRYQPRAAKHMRSEHVTPDVRLGVMDAHRKIHSIGPADNDNACPAWLTKRAQGQDRESENYPRIDMTL